MICFMIRYSSVFGSAEAQQSLAAQKKLEVSKFDEVAANNTKQTA